MSPDEPSEPGTPRVLDFHPVKVIMRDGVPMKVVVMLAATHVPPRLRVDADRENYIRLPSKQGPGREWGLRDPVEFHSHDRSASPHPSLTTGYLELTVGDPRPSSHPIITGGGLVVTITNDTGPPPEVTLTFPVGENDLVTDP